MVECRRTFEKRKCNVRDLVGPTLSGIAFIYDFICIIARSHCQQLVHMNAIVHIVDIVWMYRSMCQQLVNLYQFNPRQATSASGWSPGQTLWNLESARGEKQAAWPRVLRADCWVRCFGWSLGSLMPWFVSSLAPGRVINNSYFMVTSWWLRGKVLGDFKFDFPNCDANWLTSKLVR